MKYWGIVFLCVAQSVLGAQGHRAFVVSSECTESDVADFAKLEHRFIRAQCMSSAHIAEEEKTFFVKCADRSLQESPLQKIWFDRDRAVLRVCVLRPFVTYKMDEAVGVYNDLYLVHERLALRGLYGLLCPDADRATPEQISAVQKEIAVMKKATGVLVGIGLQRKIFKRKTGHGLIDRIVRVCALEHIISGLAMYVQAINAADARRTKPVEATLAEDFTKYFGRKK